MIFFVFFIHNCKLHACAILIVIRQKKKFHDNHCSVSILFFPFEEKKEETIVYGERVRKKKKKKYQGQISSKRTNNLTLISENKILG